MTQSLLGLGLIFADKEGGAPPKETGRRGAAAPGPIPVVRRNGPGAPLPEGGRPGFLTKIF
jgi:hypothetical protein